MSSWTNWSRKPKRWFKRRVTSWGAKTPTRRRWLRSDPAKSENWTKQAARAVRSEAAGAQAFSAARKPFPRPFSTPDRPCSGPRSNASVSRTSSFWWSRRKSFGVRLFSTKRSTNERDRQTDRQKRNYLF